MSSTEITVPSVGESITEGIVVRWLKTDGSLVEQGDPIFELETDKASSVVPAPAAGVLKIGVAEGQTVAIGATVGTIDPSGAPRPAVAPATAASGSEDRRGEARAVVSIRATGKSRRRHRFAPFAGGPAPGCRGRGRRRRRHGDGAWRPDHQRGRADLSGIAATGLVATRWPTSRRNARRERGPTAASEPADGI